MHTYIIIVKLTYNMIECRLGNHYRYFKTTNFTWQEKYFDTF